MPTITSAVLFPASGKAAIDRATVGGHCDADRGPPENPSFHLFATAATETGLPARERFLSGELKVLARGYGTSAGRNLPLESTPYCSQQGAGGHSVHLATGHLDG